MKLNETKTRLDYTAAGGNIDSLDNQRILEKLVERNVTARCSGLISTLVQAGPDLMAKLDIDFEDLAKVMSQPNYEESVMEWIEHDASIDDLVEAELIEQPPADEDDVQIEDAEDNPRKVAARNARKLSASRFQSIFDDFDVGRTSCADDIEALEHLIVDSWFAGKLGEHGEMVSSDIFPDGWAIWGRATSGQSISMDCVIADIAAEMQILVGQAYEWKF